MKKIFLGPPGSGKGTCASRIAPVLNIPHISTGELLRQNIKNNTETGIKAKNFMEEGLLVPDEIVVEMLKQRILNNDCENGFILDGFPRTIPQAEMLNQIIGIDIIINLDVTEEVVVIRNSSRICCTDCGEIYNTRTMPTKQEGICDKCGQEVKRRPDDEPEIIKKRFALYNEQTSPLLDFYKDKGEIRTITCIDPNQKPKKIIQEVLDAIEEIKKEINQNY